MKRCQWCKSDVLYIKYHDEEWGVPVHSDKKLFESLMLEGAQAGLNWIMVLKKRSAYRAAFDKFDFNVIATYEESKIQSLFNNSGIIRNKLKIKAVVKNAHALIKVREEFGTFNKYIWQFTKHKTIHNKWESIKTIPVNTDISDHMSKDLKNRGFTFVGTTICYAFMQAVGMINDHIVDCHRYHELKE